MCACVCLMCVYVGCVYLRALNACVYSVCMCVFLSLTLAGRQEERRTNERARFHKSWLPIGREGKGIVNKEKSLSGTARSGLPLPRLGRRSRPPWGSARVPRVCQPVRLRGDRCLGGVGYYFFFFCFSPQFLFSF